ncbi:ATP-grasp enzyme [Candidatus Mycobacterium wuenschmannii]|uniref:ATP-grasp enzyme n=1 Tax=Candidatus Mycobacterium wuenschmannii TaxID=3027808 RepID=A0ABY8W1K3_9MYCO|nr:ATP-grasp enzyme [Candidatus Mycobacterium wuenschmannii]WIM89001.1 ATP-grasp enzyme [Candidatus Mycobacterium wuenschmannii]
MHDVVPLRNTGKSPPGAPVNGSRSAPGANTVRTLLTLAGLLVTLPVDAVIVALALLGRARPPAAEQAGTSRRTVLITGGKMTKALQLARSFHRAGHRVILADTAKYRFTGHRFSKAVDAFYCIPEPGGASYDSVLFDIVRYEAVDTVIPVSSPAASVPDARAHYFLDGLCEVMHGAEDTVRMLDDKAEFSKVAVALGLRVPSWIRVTDPQQILNFEFLEGRSYVLKRIAYSPVGRLDLPRLSRQTPQLNVALARWLPISAEDPWILQEFIAGREYCTHGTAIEGSLQVHVCSESSASQLNYAMVDRPEIRSWVERFVSGLGVTGQFSFDFIEAADGEAYAIECNPRTHSAITTFHNHPGLAAAYLERGRPTITPLAGARPTYWIYHEAWRLLTRRGRWATLRSILRGKDAIFAWWDPLPYFMVHHLQIPMLLIDNLRRRRGWVKIDFNIGKLVEPGGD